MANSISVAVGDSETILEGEVAGALLAVGGVSSLPQALNASMAKSAAISAAVDRFGCTEILLWSEDLVFADRIGQRPLFLRERVRSCRGSET
jgi:hypothetical protein